MEKIASGDFIKIEYSGKVGAKNQVFDTTDVKTAKEAGIFDEKKKYGASLVVVGKEQCIPGLDEALQGMDVGEQKTVEIAPEKAFGARNPELVRVVPISEFRKRNIEPFPGMPVQLDNATAMIRSVNSGRVLVDMNHPLAGEKVTYEVKVAAKLKSVEERIEGILEFHELNGGKVSVKGDSAELAFSANIEKDGNFLIKKANSVGFILHFVDGIKKVRVVEEYERKEEKKDEKETKVEKKEPKEAKK
ncbi:MAG: peptidylprolyl isomerase [Candidatus Micrarchaeota archaeon]